MFIILVCAMVAHKRWGVWGHSLPGGYFTRKEAEEHITRNGGPGISYCIVEVKNVVTPQPTPTTILTLKEWR